MKQKNLHILISEELHQTFFAMAKAHDITPSQLIRKWIKLFLAGEKT